MPRRLLQLALTLTLTGAANGQVAVELLDMPTRVHSFEPVYVLYSIENTGRAPVYLPAEGEPGRGPAVYFAPLGQTPRWTGLSGDRVIQHSEEAAWLAPGERWLLYEDISYWLGVLEGEVSVQAVLSSNGRCGNKQVAGRQSFPLEPLFLETLRVGTSRYPVYRCWEGEVRSNTWNLVVEKPDSIVDKEAYDYLVRSDALLHDEETGRWLLIRGTGLEERYPSSHYTYAFLARGASSADRNRRAVALQPNHHLNPWVKAAIARNMLTSGISEAAPSQLEQMLAEMSLPTGVGEYLRQHAWNLKHRSHLREETRE